MRSAGSWIGNIVIVLVVVLVLESGPKLEDEDEDEKAPRECPHPLLTRGEARPVSQTPTRKSDAYYTDF